jgi:hypothetical protein
MAKDRFVFRTGPPDQDPASMGEVEATLQKGSLAMSTTRDIVRNSGPNRARASFSNPSPKASVAGNREALLADVGRPASATLSHV